MIAYLKHKFEKKILLIYAFRTEIKDFRPKQWLRACKKQNIKYKQLTKFANIKGIKNEAE